MQRSSATEPNEIDLAGILVVREVTSSAEMEQVFRLRDEVFVHEQSLTDDARHDPDDAISIHYLAWRDDEPIGTGRLTLFGREAQVAWVAVRAEERGTGAGRAIMLALIDRAYEEDADYVILNAQTHALGFYERLGFEVLGGEFFMGGIAHQVMAKRLEHE